MPHEAAAGLGPYDMRGVLRILCANDWLS